MVLVVIQRMSQVIHCLQNQLNLLAMETTSDYAGLMTATDALQGQVQNLQNTHTRSDSHSHTHTHTFTHTHNAAPVL